MLEPETIIKTTSAPKTSFSPRCTRVSTATSSFVSVCSETKQYNESLKIAITFNTEVSEFLKLVGLGEQDKAEIMLKNDNRLALSLGDLTDCSGREFKQITGF